MDGLQGPRTCHYVPKFEATVSLDASEADADPLTAELDQAAIELLRRLAPLVNGKAVKVSQQIVGVSIEVKIGPVSRRGRKGRGEDLVADIVAVITEADRRIKRETVFCRLKAAGKKYGQSTVNRAIGEMVKAGLLWNDGTGKGYGLPGWERRAAEPPRLFPEPEVWDAKQRRRRGSAA